MGGVVKKCRLKKQTTFGRPLQDEILKDGVEYEALVDAQNGKVLAVAQDDDQDKRHFGKHDKHHKHMTMLSPLHRKIQIIRLLPMLHLAHLKMQPLPR